MSQDTSDLIKINKERVYQLYYQSKNACEIYLKAANIIKTTSVAIYTPYFSNILVKGLDLINVDAARSLMTSILSDQGISYDKIDDLEKPFRDLIQTDFYNRLNDELNIYTGSTFFKI